MNKTMMALGVLAAAGTLSICPLCGAGATSLSAAARGPIATVMAKVVTFHVQGMTCGGCVIGVRTVLTRLPGVAKANVSYENSRAVVTFDPSKVSIERMVAAIKQLGYTATVVAG